MSVGKLRQDIPEWDIQIFAIKNGKSIFVQKRRIIGKDAMCLSYRGELVDG